MHKIEVNTTRMIREREYIKTYNEDVRKIELNTPRKTCARDTSTLILYTRTTLSLKNLEWHGTTYASSLKL